jgi:hypothetical protein
MTFHLPPLDLGAAHQTPSTHGRLIYTFRAFPPDDARHALNPRDLLGQRVRINGKVGWVEGVATFAPYDDRAAFGIRFKEIR